MMWKKKNDKQPSQETERSKCWPGLVVFNPKQFAKLKKKKKNLKVSSNDEVIKIIRYLWKLFFF